MNNLKIGARLVIGYALVLLLLLTVVAVSLLRISELQSDIDGLVKDKNIKLQIANDILFNVNAIARYHRNPLVLRTEEDAKIEVNKALDVRTKVTALYDRLQNEFKFSEKGKVMLQAVLDARKNYVEVSQELEKLIMTYNWDEAVTYFNTSYRQPFNDYLAALQKFTAFQTELAEQVGVDAAAVASSTSVLLLVIGVISIFLVVLLALVITRSITRPVNTVVEAARKMALGDFNFQLKSTARDEVGEVIRAVEGIQQSVKRMIEDAAVLSKAAVEGKLATRADVTKHHGDFQIVVKGVNDTLDAVIGPLNVAAGYVDQISKGDIPPKITDNYNGDFNSIKNNLNLCIDSLQGLIAEMNHMSQEHDAGDIDVKIDSAKFQGAYRTMAEGVNLMVFGHIAVKKKAMACINEFGKGNFEAPLEKFPGKKAFINETIEQVRANLKALIADATMLVDAAVEGKLATRADATRHQGDFRKIVDGVNKTLDLVITPVNETIAVFKKMALGDLTASMTGNYQGDFDILKTALNSSLESINDILGQVNNAVDQVAAGSVQVSQASQSLSQGATEQASSLEEITSSITEIASQTKQNTDNAIQVNTLAKTARLNAEQGNQQMQDLVAAMQDINKSAEEIKKIVKAIDDISFQINLLALNANVEAARAGKYGKGFAVVAEEVRNLAVRSANSVKDTTRMVDETIGNIERGNQLVDVTAKQLAEIVTGAAQVAVLAEEVSVASKEQSQGLEQISTGLNQIDQVTQSNTASAEESASASEELSSQSQQVKSMLAKFVLTAAESKMSNADVMAMLRQELARQGAAKKPAMAAAAAKPVAHATGRGLNPADIISLDDQNFGKF